MATPRDKYYKKIYETLVDYNDCNDAPLSKEKIRKVIRKFMADEEADALNRTFDSQNVTVDTFIFTPVTPNIKGENDIQQRN